MDSIDKLLAELKAEYEQPASKQVQPPDTKPFNQTSPSPGFQGDEAMDRLLMDVKADFQQKDLAAELQKEQYLEVQRLQQKQLQAQQLQALKKEAEDWLGKLDPFSPEGLWFERFAEKYPSKIEAAMEYLRQG